MAVARTNFCDGHRSKVDLNLTFGWSGRSSQFQGAAMRIRAIGLTCVACGALSLLSVGCVIHESPPPRHVIVEREVVEVEPPPVERVYVYEVGYPPGTYRCGDYYYCG